ncbi:RDD family protein [Acinetobacter gerneri]|uniref:RDD family protein n=1 Tax=Acinetobacter gerneri TaxID=202952 RepID=UPI003212AFDE
MQLTHDIAGFGRRFFAFLIDAILLIIFSFIVFYCIGDRFYHMPALFISLGFILILLYFGIMDSRITEGKTFGKSMLGLRVVHTDNQYLGLFPAFIRSTIFLIPICLSSFYYWIDQQNIKLILIVIFSGLASSSCYLFIFNRHSKQALHDLVVKSIVIDQEKPAAYEKEIWKFHYLFLVLFVCSVLFSRISPLIAQNNDPTLSTLIQDVHEKNPEIIHVRAKTLKQDHGQYDVALSVYADRPELVEDPNFEKRLIQSLNPQDFKNIQHINFKISSIAQFGFYVSLHQKEYNLSMKDFPK